MVFEEPPFISVPNKLEIIEDFMESVGSALTKSQKRRRKSFSNPDVTKASTDMTFRGHPAHFNETLSIEVPSIAMEQAITIEARRGRVSAILPASCHQTYLRVEAVRSGVSWTYHQKFGS